MYYNTKITFLINELSVHFNGKLLHTYINIKVTVLLYVLLLSYMHHKAFSELYSNCCQRTFCVYERCRYIYTVYKGAYYTDYIAIHCADIILHSMGSKYM